MSERLAGSITIELSKADAEVMALFADDRCMAARHVAKACKAALAESVGVIEPADPTDEQSRTPMFEGTQIKDPNGVVWTLGSGGFWYDGSGFRAYSVVGDVIDSALTHQHVRHPDTRNWPETTQQTES